MEEEEKEEDGKWISSYKALWGSQGSNHQPSDQQLTC